MTDLNISLHDYAVMNIMIWNKLEKRKQFAYMMNIMIWNKLEKRKQFAYMIFYQNIQKLLFNVISNS